MMRVLPEFAPKKYLRLRRNILKETMDDLVSELLLLSQDHTVGSGRSTGGGVESDGLHQFLAIGELDVSFSATAVYLRS